MESIGDHVQFNSQSYGDGDSNALILPNKKMKKRKGMEQEIGKKRGKVQSNKKQKLSKTQKKKLKKSEDDKEKQLLLEKALKTLNENTLPEYAFPLLQSSCNINRVDTVKEKRRKAVHLLKEGLEVPHDDDLSKKQDIACTSESEEEEIHTVQVKEFEENDVIPPFRAEKEILYTTTVPLESSQEPVHRNEVVNYETVTETKVWRFVGFASSVVGLLCYALSSSFIYLFGEWNLLKIFLYTAFSFIICLVILFTKKLQHSRSLRFKAHSAFLVLTLTSVYSFFFDKVMNGKPDAYSLISCAAFAIMSLSLSRQTQCGFEIDLLYFFLGCLIVQLMKIKLQLFILGAGFSYCLIILRSSFSSLDAGEDNQYSSELEDGNSVILYVDSLQSPCNTHNKIA